MESIKITCARVSKKEDLVLCSKVCLFITCSKQTLDYVDNRRLGCTKDVILFAIAYFTRDTKIEIAEQNATQTQRSLPLRFEKKV